MPEAARKKIIQYYELLDESDFGLVPLLEMVASFYHVPIAMVTIVNDDQLVVCAQHGSDFATMPLERSLCRFVISSDKPELIGDLSQHPQFCEHPFVTGESHYRFYAGVPLYIENLVVGSVCLIDTEVRQVDDEWGGGLEKISRWISGHLCLAREYRQLQLEHSLLDSSPAVLITWRYSNRLQLHNVSRNVKDVIAIDRQQLMDSDACFEDFLTAESQQSFAFWLQNHLDGVETAECHLKIKHPTRIVWLRMLSKAFFDQKRKLRSIQAIISDNTSHKYIEDRLSETNKQMRLLIDASGLGTWDWNVVADATKVNKRWCGMLGIDHDFYDGTTQFWRERIHPADLSQVDRALDDHLSGKTDAYTATYRLKHGNGRWVWVETYGCVVERSDRGEPMRLAGTHRDITERKEAELCLLKQGQLLAFVNKARAAYLVDHDLPKACQEILPELIDIADSQFAFIGQLIEEKGKNRLFIHAISELNWNAASEKLINLYKGRQLYFDSFDNLFGEVIKTGEEVISNRMKVHTSSRGTPSGHPPIFSFLGLPIYIQQRLVGMIGLANKADDYTSKDVAFLQPLLDALSGLYYAVELEKARGEAEERLKQWAMTDALSGLANRRAFLDYCRGLEHQAQPYAIAILDIDRFKVVNDTFGHEAGDKVICHIAKCMKEFLRTDDFVARMGGEEFAMIINNSDQASADKLLESLRSYIASHPVDWGADTISVTVSIGANWYAQANDDVLNRQLKEADRALYMAKNSSRNCLAWFVQSGLEPSELEQCNK